MENLYRMHAKNKVYSTNKKSNKPVRTSMEGMIYNGNLILDNALKAPLREDKRHDLGKGIPSVLFRECEGILLLDVLEAACIISANVGTGILMAHNKHDNTWSAPSAIGLTGVGWGLQGGIAKKDVVLFIMDKDTMNTLTADDVQFKFGPQASVTIGDAGREVQGAFHASRKGFGATVAFAYSKGLLFGFSLQGNVVAPRTACNMTFYGSTTTTTSTREILYDMEVPSNKGIEDLHRRLQMLVERGVKTMSVVAQTQTEEESTNEYEIVESPNKEISKKEDPPGIEQESDSEDDMEFIDPPAYKNDDADEEDVEFIMSSEAIEMEMKSAGVLY